MGLFTSIGKGISGIAGIVGLDDEVDAFFGFTQADANKEINQLQQEHAELQADRQRRGLVRQARVQQAAVRAQQAVAGQSSAANLASSQIMGDFASENVFIDKTAQLGKDISAQSAIIGEANQEAAVIGSAIRIGTAIASGGASGVAGAIAGSSSSGTGTPTTHGTINLGSQGQTAAPTLGLGQAPVQSPTSTGFGLQVPVGATTPSVGLNNTSVINI